MLKLFLTEQSPVKKNKIGFLVIVLIHMVCQNYIFGQNRTQDSITCDKLLSNTVTLYEKAVDAQLGICNGWNYQYDLPDFGHSFFDSVFFVNGNIVYDNILYTDVPMLYDIVKDGLVTQCFYNSHFVFLASNRISQFSLLGHLFIRISEDSAAGSPIKTGFYECLYNGKNKAWVKYKKTMEEFVDHANTIKRRAVEKKRWYLYKGGTYFEVHGKRSILKVFKDKEKEILQFSRQNKIRFKNNMDNALALIVAYYDTINY